MIWCSIGPRRATTEVFIVVLEPGEAPPLHQHDDTEQIFYVMEGSGHVDHWRSGAAVRREARRRGAHSAAHVAFHQVRRLLTTLRYLSVDAFVGEKPAAEPTWDSHVQTLCARFGWDFNQVKLQN